MAEFSSVTETVRATKPKGLTIWPFTQTFTDLHSIALHLEVACYTVTAD